MRKEERERGNQGPGYNYDFCYNAKIGNDHSVSQDYLPVILDSILSPPTSARRGLSRIARFRMDVW